MKCHFLGVPSIVILIIEISVQIIILKNINFRFFIIKKFFFTKEFYSRQSIYQKFWSSTDKRFVIKKKNLIIFEEKSTVRLPIISSNLFESVYQNFSNISILSFRTVFWPWSNRVRTMLSFLCIMHYRGRASVLHEFSSRIEHCTCGVVAINFALNTTATPSCPRVVDRENCWKIEKLLEKKIDGQPS